MGRGITDTLFDAFLHAARYTQPPRATPHRGHPDTQGERIHLVRHPQRRAPQKRERVRVQEPTTAHPPKDAAPT